MTTFSSLARILAFGTFFTVSMSAFSGDNRRDGASRTCAEQPSLVGPCFDIRGRLALHNGNPTVRILKIGTRRLLGVSDTRCRQPECSRMPQELEERLSWENVIFGDFRVCPFTKSKTGHMQFVCIESAARLQQQ